MPAIRLMTCPVGDEVEISYQLSGRNGNVTPAAK